MKRVSIYVPESVARDAVKSMKDLIITKIKNEDLEDVTDLIWNLETMIANIKECDEE